MAVLKKRKSKSSESRNDVVEIRTREPARRQFILLVVGIFVGFFAFCWTGRSGVTENAFDGSQDKKSQDKSTLSYWKFHSFDC